MHVTYLMLFCSDICVKAQNLENVSFKTVVIKTQERKKPSGNANWFFRLIKVSQKIHSYLRPPQHILTTFLANIETAEKKASKKTQNFMI